MKTLILWDIDGTLTRTLSGGGGILEEFIDTAKVVSGKDKVMPPDMFHGSTDFGVFQDIFKKSGIDQKLIPEAISELERRTTDKTYIKNTIEPVPGSKAALKELGRYHVQTYATGNSPARARAKLSCFQMDKHLDPEIGGFGFWTASRPDFLKRAVLLSQAKHGDLKRTIVIGDTPNDVAAARAVGAISIAVAGGNYSAKDLGPSEPDLLLSDLSDIDVIKDFIIQLN